jgi:hypothetical protein
MVPMPRLRTKSLERAAGTALSVTIAWLGLAAQLPAQAPEVHYFNADAMPPGAIGSLQLTRGGPLPGYFQPVEITAPNGAKISTVVDGQFEQGQPGTTTIGLLIGAVYRLRVTNIPGAEALEVYPTIEVIDRLFPPVGMEGRFPITIDLAQDDLELALDGKFVTRVIYLEEPDDALPLAEGPRQQEAYQVTPGQNPLDVADRLGRPMAIVRLGGRLPDADRPDQAFMFGSPPFLRFSVPAKAALGGVMPGANGPTIPRQVVASAAGQTTEGLTAAGQTAARRSALPPAPGKRSRLDLRNAFRPRETVR